MDVDIISVILVWNKITGRILMFMKISNLLKIKNYYKIIIIIICLNAFFELIFQYRFQTKIEIVYFFISCFISDFMIKSIVGREAEKYLPVFYYLWPFIMVVIFYISFCKLAMLPFMISSFIIVICGKCKKKWIKILILVPGLIAFSMNLLFLLGYIIINPSKEIIKTVYSIDKKYVMVVEETEFAKSGHVYVYMGRNIDFGVLGHYKPIKVKYFGRTDERPEILFIDDDFVSINGKIMEIEDNSYIDEYNSQ